MPGWELTQGWMSDEGFADRGVLNLNYFSGGGTYSKDCKPVINFRKSLLYNTLIHEDELYPEWKEKVDTNVKWRVGIETLNQQMVTWTNMLLTKRKGTVVI